MKESDWLAEFASALKQGSNAAAALFHETSYWRDLVAFTWNIVTLEGRSAIADMLAARLADVRPEAFSRGRPTAPRAGSPSRPRSGAAAAMSG